MATCPGKVKSLAVMVPVSHPCANGSAEGAGEQQTHHQTRRPALRTLLLSRITGIPGARRAQLKAFYAVRDGEAGRDRHHFACLHPDSVAGRSLKRYGCTAPHRRCYRGPSCGHIQNFKRLKAARGEQQGRAQGLVTERARRLRVQIHPQAMMAEWAAVLVLGGKRHEANSASAEREAEKKAKRVKREERREKACVRGEEAKDSRKRRQQKAQGRGGRSQPAKRPARNWRSSKNRRINAPLTSGALTGFKKRGTSVERSARVHTALTAREQAHA